jgi:hypothetical protein
MRTCSVFLLALLWSSGAFGQTSLAGQAEARLQFQEGLAQAQRGDLEAAIKSFETAYSTRPHFSVLYNIAQAQATLGRTVQAVTTFERYLSEGGTQISDTRRDEVRALIDANRQRIGNLKLSVAAPDRTRVWLDGTELSAKQLAAPLAVSAGKHQLLHSSGTGYPVLQEIIVKGAEVTEIAISAPPQAGGVVGQLTVDCDVPAVLVTIDGVEAGTTPLGPLALSGGTRRIAFNRRGYRTRELSVNVPSGSAVPVSCDLRADASLPRSVQARLMVQTTPKDASVLVDGQVFAGGVLPFGQHDLQVTRDGYLPYRRTIMIPAGGIQGHEVVLNPTAAKRARDQASSRKRKTLAYALGGTGVALLLTGGGLLLWNQKRYDDWREQEHPDLDRVASIQRVDDLSIGLAILGTGFVAGGTWAFFSSPTSDD